jgi:hypothetical protein
VFTLFSRQVKVEPGSVEVKVNVAGKAVPEDGPEVTVVSGGVV